MHAPAKRVEQLYEISKLLTAFESIDGTVSAVLGVATETLTIRSALLFDGADGRPRIVVWRTADALPEEVERARAHAEAAYRYLVGSPIADSPEPYAPDSVTVLEQPEAGAPRRVGRDARFIIIPLVVARGPIFGALQVECTSDLDESDLMFVNAIANQLAIALDRHRAWQRDIAARDRAEAELAVAGRRMGAAESGLRASERGRLSAEALRDRYAALVDNLDNAFVWEADPQTLELSYVSARIEPLLGHPRSHWTSRAASWVEHVHPLDRPALVDACRRASKDRTDQRIEHRAITRDGRELWFQTGLHLADADSDAPRIQAVSVDTTQAKRAEADLREQLAFTRSLAAGLVEGVVAVDLEGRVTFANEAACTLLGTKHADVVGRRLDDRVATLSHDGRPVESLLGRAVATGAGCASEDALFVLPDGASFPVRQSAGPIQREGRTVGAVLAFEDITARKHVEEALLSAVRTREQILAIVSHDLRNPLGVVMMGIDSLLDRPRHLDDAAIVRQRLELVARGTKRMQRLIEDLSDFASIQAGRLAMKPGVEDARQLIGDAVVSFGPMAREAKIGLTIEGGGELPPVRCDRDRILQVFSNLIGNAVKVTPPEGRITLGAEVRGDEVIFCVSDTGPGIPPDALDRIFERYERGESPRYKGTGLGLAIVRGIVAAHRGKIWAESKVGSGSTFFFSLPAEQGGSVETESAKGS